MVGSSTDRRALAATAALALLAAASLHADEYHVSTEGHDGNRGTRQEPLRTISAAAQRARPGDVITVHEGIYRERVNPPRGGESDAKRIVYRAAPGEKVVIKGSEVIKGWEKVRDDTWQVTLPNAFFGGFNPYRDVIGGEWYQQRGFPRHTGAVYLNGEWLDEARDLQQVLAPAGDRPLWKAEVGEDGTTLRAQFPGVDPNAGLVEINVRQSVFYPDRPGRDYITVRGFILCQAATPWSGAMSEQVGLIGTHWSRGWIIEDNVIRHSVNTGVTLGRYDLAGRHGVALPPATAPGYVRSIELALENGWSRERIGSHVVRRNRISHCEKNGIHGSLGGIFSVIEGNVIHDIARRGWIGGPDVAGLKLLASHDTIIRNNRIYRCGGSGGVWLDWMAQGTRVTGNLLHDNSTDLFMEVNHGPFLVDHNLFLSRHSIRDWSQGSAYAHNLVAGSVSSRREGRETPYFRPHTVEEMRLSSINHKDARIHNNLFVGGNGPAGWGDDANLQAAGNVHLRGLAAELEEKTDGAWLKVPQDPSWAAQKRAVVTTGSLGTAGIPSAPFENPDGTPCRLDIDYFGESRDAGNPAPGPFRFRAKESAPSEEIRLRVWPK